MTRSVAKANPGKIPQPHKWARPCIHGASLIYQWWPPVTYFENRLRSRTRVQTAAIVDFAIVDFSYETNVVYVNACSEKCHTSKLILRIS